MLLIRTLRDPVVENTYAQDLVELFAHDWAACVTHYLCVHCSYKWMPVHRLHASGCRVLLFRSSPRSIRHFPIAMHPLPPIAFIAISLTYAPYFVPSRGQGALCHTLPFIFVSPACALCFAHSLSRCNLCRAPPLITS